MSTSDHSSARWSQCHRVGRARTDRWYSFSSVISPRRHSRLAAWVQSFLASRPGIQASCGLSLSGTSAQIMMDAWRKNAAICSGSVAPQIKRSTASSRHGPAPHPKTHLSAPSARDWCRHPCHRLAGTSVSRGVSVSMKTRKSSDRHSHGPHVAVDVALVCRVSIAAAVWLRGRAAAPSYRRRSRS